MSRDIVKRMAMRHDASEQTLTPLSEIPNVRASRAIIPNGHGWATAK
ncbi:hypothetical protein NZK35_22765 [Stieleria sp. ICT_E10.1]|nr:hypothetical protein [Stieleria sedimenti]MCS7469485.1 hypothetical protein [Stieleria sedimenti]